MHSLVLKQSLYFNNLMSEIMYNLLFMFQQIDLAISHYDTHIFYGNIVSSQPGNHRNNSSALNTKN